MIKYIYFPQTYLRRTFCCMLDKDMKGLDIENISSRSSWDSELDGSVTQDNPD